MSNTHPARSATPTQARILEVLALADYREVLRIGRGDSAALRSELSCEDLDADAFAERIRDWLGRTWIIDVSVIIIDAHETSSLKE